MLWWIWGYLRSLEFHKIKRLLSHELNLSSTWVSCITTFDKGRLRRGKYLLLRKRHKAAECGCRSMRWAWRMGTRHRAWLQGCRFRTIGAWFSHSATSGLQAGRMPIHPWQYPQCAGAQPGNISVVFRFRVEATFGGPGMLRCDIWWSSYCPKVRFVELIDKFTSCRNGVQLPSSVNKFIRVLQTDVANFGEHSFNVPESWLAWYWHG